MAKKAPTFGLRPLVAALIGAGERVDHDLWRLAYPLLPRDATQGGGPQSRLPLVKNRAVLMLTIPPES